LLQLWISADMSRLPGLVPAELDAYQGRVYESIAGGDRAKDASFPLTHADGALVGPFNPLLFSPNVGDAVQQLGAAIRFHCGLSGPVREVAILAVATQHDCEFERWAHEPIARRVGVSDNQIAALRAGAVPAFDNEDEDVAAAYQLCAESIENGRVGDATYERAVAELGNAGVVELVTLLGYYGLLAQLMNVFEIGVPD
jgi:4-carboxymuconolactone decarboxylase